MNQARKPRDACLTGALETGRSEEEHLGRRLKQTPLLTREQEKELGRAIESGRRKVVAELIDTPAFLGELSALVEELRRGELSPNRLLKDADAVGDEGDLADLQDRVAGRLSRIVSLGRQNLKLGKEARSRHPERLERNRRRLVALFEKSGLDYAWVESVAGEYKDLHRRVLKRGGKRRRVARRHGITWKRLQEINRVVREGERESRRALDRLVESNLRLVMFIARRYLGRGLLFSDLVQEGTIGLMKAAQKYDYRKGVKFSTYATWWIRQAVARALAVQSRTVRLPVKHSENLARIHRASHQLVQELGREPTLEEIAGRTGFQLKEIRDLLQRGREAVSLQKRLGPEEGLELLDLVADEEAAGPDQLAGERELSSRLKRVLATLSPREERVLRLRFGIGDGVDHTLKEIGQEFEVSRERIRQIEAEALRKLRHVNRTKILIPLANDISD